MATYKMKHTNLHYLPNPTVSGYKLSAVNSIANDGTTAYILKSCGASTDEILYPMVIYKITNFTGGNAVQTKITVTEKNKTAKIARHANGITYAKRPKDKNGYLFIATMNHSDKPQLLKVTLKGSISKKYQYLRNGVPSTFSCVNYIGTDSQNRFRFIVGRGTNGGRYCYDFATIIGSYLVSDNLNFKGVVTGDQTSQDLFWASNKLYHIFFSKDNSGRIKYNFIYQYSTKNITNGCTIEPTHVYKDDAKSEEKKYEIEGLVYYKSTFYGASNRESTKSGDNKDSVVKIVKK